MRDCVDGMDGGRRADGAGAAPRRLPDFVIGGAPKCGTTSLHFILAQNPAIGIPDEEIHYFDADDPVAHPDFLFAEGGRLDWFDPRPGNAAGADWYAGRFAPHAHKPLVGEDSTTYLFSEAAPERMRALMPEARLVFLLRDPVRRAYSQYWHLVRTSRTADTFERAITRQPSIVLGSTYAPHLRRWMAAFGEDRVRVGLLEDLIRAPQPFVDAMCAHIGAPSMTLDPARSWFNRTSYPGRPALLRAANRIGGGIVTRRYRHHMGRPMGRGGRMAGKLHYRWFRHVMPRLLMSDAQPPMREDTRAYLAQHLSARNAGLSDLLGRDLGDVWRGFAS